MLSANGQKFQSQRGACGQTVGMEQPSDDTPSASHSLSSSLREGAGNVIIQPGTIHRTARKAQGCGRFSSPLRNSKDFGFYHSTDDTPSVSFADSSLREGAGNDGAVPFNEVLAKIRGYGRFSSPLRKGGCHSSQYTPLWGVIQFSGVSKPWGFLDCQFQESRHMSARVSLASQWSTSRLLVGSA